MMQRTFTYVLLRWLTPHLVVGLILGILLSYYSPLVADRLHLLGVDLQPWCTPVRW